MKNPSSGKLVLASIIDYLGSVAENHQIDPFIFVLVYLISTPPFLWVSARLIGRVRRRRPLEALIFAWALLYIARPIFIFGGRASGSRSVARARAWRTQNAARRTQDR